MKSFTNSELRNISRAFRNSHGCELTLNTKSKYVKKLIDEFNLSSCRGTLTLSTNEKRQIKMEIEQSHNIDNLLDTDSILALSRIEEAKRSNDEKSDSVAPSKNYMYVKGKAPLIHGREIFSPHTCLRVNIADLILKDLDEVVCVENLAAFDNVDSVMKIKSNMTVVYRGHNVDARAVRALLQAASKYKFKVSVWADFDPSGVVIADSTPNVSELFAPIVPEELIGAVNQPELFLQQYKNLNRVESLRNRLHSEELDYMLKKKLAITQEHQIAHNLKLQRVSLQY